MKCHYDTLGVSKDASTEEVKAAFRKLSMETHPDMGKASSCAERFKLISQAASVLTNPQKREIYDQKLSNRFQRDFFHRQDAFRNKNDTHSSARKRTYAHERPIPGYRGFIVNMFRPRILVLGSLAFFTAVSAAKYVFGIEKKKSITHGYGQASMVQAWKNPATGQWESPAPWDPAYKRLNPKLELRPRDQVRSRKQ